MPRLIEVTSPLPPPDREEGPGGQGAEGAVFRTRALVLYPAALPRSLGAHHGPTDLHRPGLASTPGHLVSPQGQERRGPCPAPTLWASGGSLSVSSLHPTPPFSGPGPSPRSSCRLRKAADPQTLSSACPKQSSSCWGGSGGVILSCLPASLGLEVWAAWGVSAYKNTILVACEGSCSELDISGAAGRWGEAGRVGALQ